LKPALRAFSVVLVVEINGCCFLYGQLFWLRIRLLLMILVRANQPVDSRKELVPDTLVG
jgi:hypothetical protein